MSKGNTKVMHAVDDVVFEYHRQTKHHLSGYAKGPDTIDWSMQPEAFRHYQHAPIVELPLTANNIDIAYDELFTPNHTAPQQLDLAGLGAFFELSLGLSAWKQYGADRWALRCNPSSGNLHPTEAYALLRRVDDIADGIYHYCSDQHQLEQRCLLATSALVSPDEGGFLLCLSSIHWREAWKYGERAFRYSQLDIGHAIAAVRFAAACLGWRVSLLTALHDEQLENLFGFNRRQDFHGNELESAEILLQINTSAAHSDISLADLTASHWSGQANQLDRKHFYHWPIIDSVAQATRNPGIAAQANYSPPPAPAITPVSEEKAASVIHQRRSAQYFDARANMPAETFYQFLDKLIVREQVPPFDALPWQPRIHPVIFVHRVTDLPRGLYILPRHTQAQAILQPAMRHEFLWEKADHCPGHIPLYKLVLANCEKAARTLCCHQDIAADSAFSIGMLAEFRDQLMDRPWQYRQLYWEAGSLGQSLYLEAEAHSLRATGIGCFFDDNFHEVLGIASDQFQSLYHFTVGTPIVDNRLITLPAYQHLTR